VLNIKKIRGLNLPGTPWATSACCGMTFTLLLLVVVVVVVVAAAVVVVVVVVVECESEYDRMVSNALRKRAQKFGFKIMGLLA